MQSLTTFQIIVLYALFVLTVVGLLRIIFGIGDYLSSKANLYRAKVKILKNRNRDLFNKWYD
jgi:hypothetical protein